MDSETSELRRSGGSEITLRELGAELWREKWVLFGVGFLVTFVSLVYSLLLPPIFETASRVLPPLNAEVAPLNLGREQADLPLLDPEEVYALFTRNLTAEANRRRFFDAHYRPYWEEQNPGASRDNLLRRMRQDVVVRRPDERSNSQIMEVIVRAGDPEKAAEWNSLFLKMAADAAFRDMRANTTLEVGNVRAVLEHRIEVLRVSATAQRHDRITRLKDALSISEAVGIAAPQVTAGRTAAEGELSEMLDGTLTYMRGTKAIQAELALLQGREDEDPYIEELRELEQQIALLALVNSEHDGASLFTLDSAAEVPDEPIAPRKSIIVILGAVLGGILGTLIAMVRIGLRRNVG